jgi:hypothetical protein
MHHPTVDHDAANRGGKDRTTMLKTKLCAGVIKATCHRYHDVRALADLKAAGQMLDPSVRAVDGKCTSQFSTMQLSSSTVRRRQARGGGSW